MAHSILGVVVYQHLESHRLETTSLNYPGHCCNYRFCRKYRFPSAPNTSSIIICYILQSLSLCHFYISIPIHYNVLLLWYCPLPCVTPSLNPLPAYTASLSHHLFSDWTFDVESLGLWVYFFFCIERWKWHFPQGNYKEFPIEYLKMKGRKRSD